MQWSFSGKQEVYLDIAQKYREYISLGVLKEGDRLPSVRTAAVELGVNPNTVARAYAELEREGVIHSLPKKGVYVSGVISHADDGVAEAVRALRDRGITKERLMEIIEEVYCNDD